MTDNQSVLSSSSRIRGKQNFSLASLLAVLTVCAILLAWFVDHQRLVKHLVSGDKALEDRILLLEQKDAEKAASTLNSGQVSIDPIIVNLNDGKMDRYLKLQLALVVADADTPVANRAVSDLKTEIRDAVLILLSDTTVQNLAGSEKQKALKVDLSTTINQQLKDAGHPEYVKAVLFDEFNVQ